MPGKKTIGWICGSVLVLGVSGGILMKYNSQSMAHVFYQQIVHKSDNSSTNSSIKTISKSSTKLVKKNNSSKMNTDNIRSELKKINYTGSYAVIKDGEISKPEYVGKQANKMSGRYYQVIDLENMVTTAAILHLADQGKLSLTTPISHYYSSLNVSDSVTVKSLLQMTSGLINNSIPSSQLTNVLDWNINHAQIGTVGQYSYEEINYVLLEGIISQVTNQSYQTYIEKTFLKPNHLDKVKFASTGNSQKLAPAYNGNGQKVNQTKLEQAMNEQMGQNQLIAMPDAFLKLTQILVKDYGKYSSFIGGQPTGRLIQDGTMLYGSGGIIGYRTSVAISADGKKGIVLMGNDSNGSDNLTTEIKNLYQKLTD